ncbi:MAG: adenylate/guanylate cyclase domain-containing protein [Pseudomonadota bacterium]
MSTPPRGLPVTGVPVLSLESIDRARETREWLSGSARLETDASAFLETLAGHCLRAGVPVDRITGALPTLHAMRRGLGRVWTRGEGVRVLEFSWDNQDEYLDSPYYQAHQTGDWVAFRLDEIDDSAYGIVRFLREEGFTHYACMPVFFRDGTEGGLTFATRDPAGFRPDDLGVLKAIGPAISVLLDLNRVWRLLEETLQMYVGEEPKERILSGQVRRGDVLRIGAGILFADMRGFTALSASLDAEETVALLNRYFDCVVPPIEARGGQVLKYIGDGVLAIRKSDRIGTAACAGLLEAARDIARRVREATAKDPPDRRFRIKISLHYGEVAYGNIGSGARLDYTVVGNDVNLASRLADLAGHLDRPILASDAFRRRFAEAEFTPFGAHGLKGVDGTVPVFVPCAGDKDSEKDAIGQP